MADLEKWWSQLKVAEKERIASKINKSLGNEPRRVYYPECTAVWNSISDERKKKVYEHCVDAHGLLILEEFEGNPLTD